VQVPHHGDRHHPSRLRPVLAVSLVVLAAAPAAGASSPRYTALPSPSAPLSRSPPISGGATASAEGVRHRIDAVTSVQVSLDATGAPFAVQAVQTLHVRVQGDYFFTIGAPVLAAHAARGSSSAPGVRSDSILWAGFNTNRRTLAATITLEPRIASAALPLRIDARDGRVTLTNLTRVAVSGFSADVETTPLRGYARRLEADIAAGRLPAAGGVLVTSTPQTDAFTAVADLHVSGVIGDRRVDQLLGAAPLTIAAHGPIRLRVEPIPPLALLRRARGSSGTALLRNVTAALFDVARARQYDSYLGNPDPSGANTTTYRYRSSPRPSVAAAPTAAAPKESSSLRTLVLVAGLLAALSVGILIWARS
jgi:hypothetical protein